MNKKQYQEIVKKNQIKVNKIKKFVCSFVVGGLIGLIAQSLYFIGYKYLNLSIKDASIFSTLIIILVTALLTGTGIYKKLGSFSGAGLFVPTTGFANSVVSSSIESKFEGPIFGIGSRMFYLAGSVITYGIFGAFLYALIRLVLNSFGVSL